jgi:hypothetical protein
MEDVEGGFGVCKAHNIHGHVILILSILYIYNSISRISQTVFIYVKIFETFVINFFNCYCRFFFFISSISDLFEFALFIGAFFFCVVI